MRKSTYYCLVEALRRYTRFHPNDPLDSPRTWLGLGNLTAYKDAIKEGYMRHGEQYNGGDVGPKPRVVGWLALTPKGAEVVQQWLDQGYDFKLIESGGEPPFPLN